MNFYNQNLYRKLGVVSVGLKRDREAKKYFKIASTMEENELTFEAYIDFHALWFSIWIISRLLFRLQKSWWVDTWRPRNGRKKISKYIYALFEWWIQATLSRADPKIIVPLPLSIIFKESNHAKLMWTFQAGTDEGYAKRWRLGVETATTPSLRSEMLSVSGGQCVQTMKNEIAR